MPVDEAQPWQAAKTVCEEGEMEREEEEGGDIWKRQREGGREIDAEKKELYRIYVTSDLQ